jgi:ribosome-associated protein
MSASEAGSLDPEALADRIAAIASDRKAIDIRVVDLRGLVGYTDFLVICTARNERQARSIHDEVRERLKGEEGLLPSRVEGLTEGRWVLVDYLHCVLHVFTPEARDFYRLETLWGEAPRLELELEPEGEEREAASGA